jgi:hypothetical protein
MVRNPSCRKEQASLPRGRRREQQNTSWSNSSDNYQAMSTKQLKCDGC